MPRFYGWRGKTSPHGVRSCDRYASATAVILVLVLVLVLVLLLGLLLVIHSPGRRSAPSLPELEPITLVCFQVGIENPA